MSGGSHRFEGKRNLLFEGLSLYFKVNVELACIRESGSGVIQGKSGLIFNTHQARNLFSSIEFSLSLRITVKKPLVLINGLFLTETLRGVQRYATEMVRALSRLKHRYRILVVAPRGRLLQTLPDVVQDTFPLTGAAWEQLRLPFLAKKLNASLLYCPCNRAPLFETNIPLILTIHDAAVFSGPEWFTKSFQLLYHNYFPRIGKISSRVITCSNFAKRDLLKYGIASEEKLRVIYEGSDHMNGHSMFKKNNGDHHLKNFPLNGKRYVLNLGSRDPRKNVKLLCDAWKSIPEEVKQGRILAIAGGKFFNNFADEKISNLPDDVIFIGYVLEEHLSHLYNHADFFVFPSLYEGFGLPPLEAMACGTPVLASHSASLPEVCGGAALYCDPRNIHEITNKLTQIITDRSLKEDLRQKGLERAKSFTWEKAAQQLLTVFEEVIAC
jgi:glycosyltransferase involved in cell wall biosynthesis